MMESRGKVPRLPFRPFFIKINQRNFRAFTAEELSRSGSYAASASGDQRRFAVQSVSHNFAVCGKIPSRRCAQRPLCSSNTL